MLRIIATILTFLAGTIAACAQAAPAAVKPCFGVMSAVGTTFTLQKVGITVFQNDYKKAPIAAWGIDEYITRRLASAAGGRPIVRLDYSKPDLASFEAPRSNPFEQRTDLHTIVKNAAAKSGCERSVAAVKVSTRIGSSNQGMYGLGILETAAGTPLARTYLFVSMMLLVVDGRTRDTVRIERVNEVANPIDWLMSGSGLVQQVDSSWWPASGEVAGNTRMKNGIQALIDRGLTPTLKNVQPATARQAP
jgi:hypothetical protein